MPAELARSLREKLDHVPTSSLVVYLSERLGEDVAARALERAVAGEHLPEPTRSLAEQVAERMGLLDGRLELVYETGRLRRVFRVEKFGALALERYDPAPDSGGITPR
jgi:hypothetical protein